MLGFFFLLFLVNHRHSGLGLATMKLSLSLVYLFVILVAVYAQTIEEYESKECEVNTLNGVTYDFKRNITLNYNDTEKVFLVGSYIMEDVYYEEGSECSSDNIAIRFAEKGKFAFTVGNMGQTAYTLFQFNFTERHLIHYSDVIGASLDTVCGVQAEKESLVDITDYSCQNFRFRSIDSCGVSVQPRNILRKSFLQMARADEDPWCDWSTDQTRDLRNFGKELAYIPTHLENVESQFNKIIVIIQLILMALSILGALFTIITFLVFPRIRTYPIKLICWLCLTIVLGQTLFIITAFAAKGTDICEAFGALVHYFFLTNFTWCSCLAFNFYQLVCIYFGYLTYY